jgi:hypothetical protein
VGSASVDLINCRSKNVFNCTDMYRLFSCLFPEIIQYYNCVYSSEFFLDLGIFVYKNEILGTGPKFKHKIHSCFIYTYTHIHIA